MKIPTIESQFSKDTSLDDGRCFVQAVLAPGVTSGKASSTQVGQAAFDTFQHCVIKYGYGGIAANIGRC